MNRDALIQRLRDTAQMKTQFPPWLLTELENAATALAEQEAEFIDYRMAADAEADEVDRRGVRIKEQEAEIARLRDDSEPHPHSAEAAWKCMATANEAALNEAVEELRRIEQVGNRNGEYRWSGENHADCIGIAKVFLAQHTTPPCADGGLDHG